MKFLKYSLIAALALSGALCACDDDNNYAPGAPVSGDEVYFPINTSTTVDIPTDATSIPVAVNRVNADKAITVDVESTVTDSEGADVSSIFSVPSQVAFAAGEETADINVGVDFSKVVPDEEYSLTLKLTGDNTTPYGASTRTYTLVYAPWSDWEFVPGEEGVYTFTVLNLGSFEVGVVTRKSLVNPNRVQYATVGPFTNGINFVISMDLTKTVEVDGEEYPAVSLETYKSGLTNGSGSDEHFWWMDVRTWIAEFWGQGWDNVDRIMELNKLPPSYFNTKTGLFSLDVAVISDDPDLPGTAAAYGVQYEYLQLPGYKTYNLEFQYTGNFVDPANEIEYAIVSAYKSDDVKSYIYDIFPGKLEGDELEQAIADMKTSDNLESVSESSTNLAFTLPEDGTYTVVGLGKDEANDYVCTQVYSFKYKSVQGATVEKWNSLGYVEYTDGIVCSLFSSIAPYTFDVEIQESEETPGLYRLVNPYEEFAGMLKVPYSGKHYLTIDAQDPTRVNIPYSELGLDLGYGEMAVQARADIFLNNGYSADQIAEAGWFGTLEDDLITFPAGSLIIFDDDGSYYGNLDPNNPTGETDEFNPYYGEGSFCVDMAGVSSAASLPSKASTHAKNSISLPVKNSYAKEFHTSFKVSKKSNKLKTIDAKTLNQYRLANPQIISL